MNKICISSDVTTTYLVLNVVDLTEASQLKLDSLNQEEPLLQIRAEELFALKEELDSLLNKYLLHWKDRDRSNINITYRERTYKLDIKKDYDFRVCAIADLHELSIVSEKHNGALFIYYKNSFDQIKCDSIISFLRVKGGQSKEGIIKGINQLRQDLELEGQLDASVLEEGLTFLVNQGMLYYDDNVHEYKLTARGYMYC